MNDSERKLLDTTPPLRVENQPDDHDDQRALWAWDHFTSQDSAYRLRDRSIEENVRMLAGQQWWVYHHLLGWRDVTYWMTEEEKRWRQRPVFNRILPWFILTHARMTENPFICTFLPGPDRRDAELAEVLDILYKTKWRDVGMTEIWDRAAAWMIVAGAAYLQTRFELGMGDWRPWVGEGEVPLLGPDGRPAMDEMGQPVMVKMRDVPFDKEGKPLAAARPDGSLEVMGEPHAERAGDITVDVYSPLEVRGQWGPIPWHKQTRHMVRSYLTPEQVWNKWGIECEPDVRGEAAVNAGFLDRVLLGHGFFGAASAAAGTEFGGTGSAKDGYCVVQTTWEAPNERIEGMEEGPDKPGGRLLVCTKNKTLRDGERPFAFPHTSPIRQYDFIRVPGRPSASTPQEVMNSPQRALNTAWKQTLEYGALCSSPQMVYDNRSGLEQHQLTNRPGQTYGVRMRPGIEPVQWIVPPPISADVWRIRQGLVEELQFLGSTHNTSPTDLSKDASGELVRELRFNDDRFLGPTMRRAAEEMGRLIQDWRAMWPLIYDEETVLKYTGEDNVARTLMLMPDIWKAGSADVVPDTESMLPEGRGERRARIYQMWKDGAWGDPQSPGALRKLHELSQFPHFGRTSKPGGVHWTTAEQENGELLNGQNPPTYEWYDDEIHLACIEDFMATPEWRRLPDNVKIAFVLHRQLHLVNLQKKAMQQAAMAREQAVLDAKAQAEAMGGSDNDADDRGGKRALPPGRGQPAGPS